MEKERRSCFMSSPIRPFPRVLALLVVYLLTLGGLSILVYLILRHLQDRTYEEIAKLLSTPVGTIKTHLFRPGRF
jgi:hypothetical protein